MNLEAEKALIKRKIDELEDSELLETISHLLQSEHSDEIDNELQPMSIEEFRQMIEKSERDVSEGKIYRHEDVMREIF